MNVRTTGPHRPERCLTEASMARNLVRDLPRLQWLGKVCLVLTIILVCGPLLTGQATPWYQQPAYQTSNGQHPEYPQPASAWTPPGSPVNMIPPSPAGFPGVNVYQASPAWQPSVQSGTTSPWMQPNAYSRPSIDQTRWYVENNPYFRNIDPGIKEAIIYSGSGSGLLSGSYLPNGSPNPFSQNGSVAPNWYLPATWTSPTMNWQGVQQNGFLPSASSGNSFNPPVASYTSTSTPVYSNYQYNSYNRPTYTPSFNQTSATQAPGVRSSFNPTFDTIANRPTATFNPSNLIHDAGFAAALHETGGDKIALAIDHSELARFFLQGDNPGKALEQVSLAESFANASGNPGVGIDVLRLKAAALVASGQFEQAIANEREIMKRFRLMDDVPNQAATFTMLGWAFQSIEKPVDAINAYNSAFTLYKEMQDRDGQTRALVGLGSVYSSMGDYSKAHDQYLKAAPIATDDQFARILVSFAEDLQSQGMYKETTRVYERAWELSQNMHDKVLSGAIKAGMGRSAMGLHHYYEALDDYDSAQSLMIASGDRTGQAGVLASIAQWHFQTGIRIMQTDVLLARSQADALAQADIAKKHLREAREDYGKALGLMQETGNRIGEIGILTETGEVLDYEGKTKLALDYYKQAVAKLEDVRNSARLEQFRTNLSEQAENLYRRLVQLEARRNHMEEAFELSEQARARTFLDLLGTTQIKPPHNTLPQEFASQEEQLRKENIVIERQLAQESAKPLPEVNVERLRSLQAQLDSVHSRYQHSLDELKISDPEYTSFLSVTPLTLQQIQKQLGPDATALSYFSLPDMTLAFVITSSSFDAFKLKIAEGALALSIATLTDFAGETETTEETKQLYKVLIAPLRSHLKSHTLLISPYGVLHDIPFGALSPDGNEFLADSYSIALLPSISAWPYLHAKAKHGMTNALVMANDEAQGLPLLGSGHSEAEAIAALFGTKPLFGQDASVSTLREHGGDYSIVHLMAHLDHDSQSPRSSHIVLDRDLDVDEVLGLNLEKASLVVLSGCRSQLGKRTRGDDMIALSRAFMYAGASSVVASLWSVDDEATRQLMISFYSHLRDGLTKADALRAAQKDIRRSYPNPYYWASFELLGDPGSRADSSPTVGSQPPTLRSSPSQNLN